MTDADRGFAVQAQNELQWDYVIFTHAFAYTPVGTRLEIHGAMFIVVGHATDAEAEQFCHAAGQPFRTKGLFHHKCKGD